MLYHPNNYKPAVLITLISVPGPVKPPSSGTQCNQNGAAGMLVYSQRCGDVAAEASDVPDTSLFLRK